MYITFIFWLIYIIYSSIAQSVEHATVNRRVVGSSPTWGAKGNHLVIKVVIFLLFKTVLAFSIMGSKNGFLF